MTDNVESTSLNAGTRFPFINLEKALARASQLFEADSRGREMTLTAAFQVWEYSDKSSGGFQTIAALKMYGILKEAAGGDSRKIALSDLALRYFRDEREDEKAKIAREFALKPKLIAALWPEWSTNPPADAIARSHLKAERMLSDQGARSLLAIYKDNLAFTELKGEPKVEVVNSETPPVSPPQNDFFIDAVNDFMGIKRKQPMEQAVHSQPSERSPVADGMRREVITLDEGDVVISYPENLSADSFDDLSDHLELFVKKMQRRTARPENMSADAYRLLRVLTRVGPQKKFDEDSASELVERGLAQILVDGQIGATEDDEKVPRLLRKGGN